MLSAPKVLGLPHLIAFKDPGGSFDRSGPEESVSLGHLCVVPASRSLSSEGVSVSWQRCALRFSRLTVFERSFEETPTIFIGAACHG